MYILAVLPLMTACEKEEQPSIGQTQLATPVVAVKIDVYAKTIIVSWQAVENADNYHYKISGDEILHGTRETSLELLPFSQFLEGNHSIMVQAVNTYDPEQFIASEWCKVDFSVESTKLRVPESLNCDVDKENCSVNVSWTPVENAVSYLYKIDDGEEIAAAGTEVSFSLFDYTPGEHRMSVRALAEEMSPDHLASDWSEAYFTITDEPLPGMLGNKPLDHARLGDFYLNDGSLVRADSKLSEGQANACIGIVFYSGRHETDQSDYTQPLTAGGPVLGNTVHGYVMSLTYVPTQAGSNSNKNVVEFSHCNAVRADGSPDGDKRSKHLYTCRGTCRSRDDFNGYYNCMAILNYAATVNCCIFPALHVAINYGKRGYRVEYITENGYDFWNLVDAGDVYDWQLSLAAPQNSSGWFLPSYGQLYYFYPKDSYSPLVPADRTFVRGQIEKVKNATTREELKEHIDPQYYSFAIHSYYSSSEFIRNDGYGDCYVVNIYGDGYYGYGCLNYVRPVLAF
ncbi:hypothetical protein [uncultured Bacteroides sp.]|uniref:hypothetical protein n=1 Tax=uncultured Bacteroides sp. TaxID=162156 RepID=UPI0026107F25|nr:hypothetical protein [uncultured Bacteroides sp.]